MPPPLVIIYFYMSECKTILIDDKRVRVEGKVYAEKDLFGNVCALYKYTDDKTIQGVKVGTEDNIKNIQEVKDNVYIIESY
jgi:hypothetical protein